MKGREVAAWNNHKPKMKKSKTAKNAHAQARHHTPNHLPEPPLIKVPKNKYETKLNPQTKLRPFMKVLVS